MKRNEVVLIAVLMTLLVMPESALAYVGPGSSVTMIGAALAFIGAIVFAIIGFLWYPIKRLLGALKGRKAKEDQAADQPSR